MYTKQQHNQRKAPLEERLHVGRPGLPGNSDYECRRNSTAGVASSTELRQVHSFSLLGTGQNYLTSACLSGGSLIFGRFKELFRLTFVPGLYKPVKKTVVQQ